MSFDTARTILQKNGFKCTPGRIALIELLLKTKQPLSQQDISSQLSDIDFNFVSIYRSLNAFLEAGIVHRVETGDRIWRFALSDSSDGEVKHPHFVCKSCGKVECINEMKIPQLSDLRPGYTVEDQEIFIRGLCDKCSR